MAKILLGPTVIGIRGTVGGITFSQNRAGPFAKSWRKPSNPRSITQRTSQNRLAYWSTQWRSLSAANKATWDAYAAAPAQQLTDSLGQPYYASGFNWYILTQRNLALIGAATIPTAPVGARLAAPTVTAFSYSISSSSQPRWTMAVASPGLALNHAMWISLVNSQGVAVPNTPYYFMKVAIPNVSRQVHCSGEFDTKFGTNLITQKAFASIYTIDAEGQASPEAFNSVNASA